MENKILIIGLFGFKNTGDDLMLDDFLKLNPNYDSNNTYVVWMSDKESEYAKIFLLQHNINLIEYNYLCNTDIKFSKIIYAGGAISWNHFGMLVYNRLNESEIFFESVSIEKNIPLYFVKYPNIKILDVVKEIILKCKKFSVRDIYSKSRLVELLNIDPNLITFEDDIVLRNYNSKTIGLALYDRYDILKNKFIIECIIDFCEKYKYNLLFILLNYRYKIKFIDYIKEFDFKNINYSIACDFYTPQLIINIVKGCDILVTEKYHTALIGLKENIKVISLLNMNCNNEYIYKMNYINQAFHNEDNIIPLNHNILYDKLRKISNLDDCYE